MNPKGNPQNLTAPKFVASETGNPGGKPKHARNRLQGAFLNCLADDFDAHGKRAIVAAREQDPLGYVKAIASLMPRQFEQTQPLEDLSDAELTAGIALLRSRLAASARAGSESPGEPQSLN